MSPVRSPHGLGSVSFLFPGLVRGLNPSFLTPVGPGHMDQPLRTCTSLSIKHPSRESSKESVTLGRAASRGPVHEYLGSPYP